jgi:predicted PurR-regulated permease PerM
MTDKRSWSAATKGFVLTTLVLAALWLLFMLKAVLTALVMGALFAYLLNPITRIMAGKTRWSRPFAARVVFAGFLLILLALSTTLGKVAVDQYHLLEGEFINAVTAFENWISQPIELFGYIFHPDKAVKNLDKVMRNSLASIPEISFNILSILTSNLLLGLIFIASFYHLLVDGHKLQPCLKEATPGWDQSDFWRLLDELNKVWGVFLRVQLLMFVILGLMMGAGFLVVIWLFRSGLIPFSPLALIALVVLVVTIAQQIDNLWLRPQLMGKSLLLHPWYIFVGLTATLITGNLLAVFFVVPVMATVKIMGRYFHLKLLGLPPWPDNLEDD